jgi:hypothetical protein
MESVAIFGGFMVAIWALISFCVNPFQSYEGEKDLIEDLYVLNPDNVLTRKNWVNTAVKDQVENDVSSLEYLFCCCCPGPKT